MKTSTRSLKPRLRQVRSGCVALAAVAALVLVSGLAGAADPGGVGKALDTAVDAWRGVHAAPVLHLIDVARAQEVAGNAAGALDTYGKALAECEKRQLTDSARYVRCRMACVLCDLGRGAEALARIEGDRKLTRDPWVRLATGRALLASGQADNAIPHLRAAAKGDSTVAPLALYYLGKALVDTKRPMEAARLWQQLAALRPGTAIARCSQSDLNGLGFTKADLEAPTWSPGWLQPPSGKPWRLSLSLGGAYSSNVWQASDSVRALLADDDVDDFAATMDAFLDYEFVRQSDLRIGATAVYSGRWQEEFGSLDYHGVGGSLYVHRFFDDVRCSLTVFGNRSWLDGQNDRADIGLTPAVRWLYNGRDWLDLAYTCEYEDAMRTPLLPEDEQDGCRHTLALNHTWIRDNPLLNGRRIAVVVGASLGLSDKEGEDYDYWTAGVVAGVHQQLPWGLLASLNYAYARADYRYASIWEPGKDREDHVHSVGVRLEKRLSPELGVYIGYGCRLNGSNTDRFDYDEHVTYCGLVLDL